MDDGGFTALSHQRRGRKSDGRGRASRHFDFRRSPAALLAGPHSASHSPDPDSPRQPRQFPAQFHYGGQLFCDSVWSFDSGSAFHRDSRRIVLAVEALAVRLLACAYFWTRRHYTFAEVVAGTRL